jgi:hydroxymethylpyrimidine pyrophosphatase-like HAD family hydrolase
MLSASDNSFAMSNSESHAITAGKHITLCDNNNDGVAKTLENLFMPK